ncbi:ribosomal protein S2 [Ascodesmis nigricans]|uniref:Ribosomal protein S2 n=1 Tax=Ascodesmis nigricans TaxID=341454 RepID=A0A4S2N6S2_9PEZI|nr:ribosomal protein S2 [Ascodesmis nigricans]
MIIRRALPRPGLPAPSQCLRFPRQQRTLATSPGPESDLARHGKVLPTEPPARSQGHRIRPVTADRPFTLKDEFENFQNFRKQSSHTGSRLSRHYAPYKHASRPPSPSDLTLELLMASGAHLGHATALWNPGNQRYIFGIRNGIHIIGLEHTLSHLRRAARVVDRVVEVFGTVLVVGTRAGQERTVVQTAEMMGGYHLFTRWTAGGITNARQILAGEKVVEINDLGEPNPSGPMEDPIPVRPDLVICLNPLENYVLLKECGQFGIPTIGVIDTDADPTWVTYPIPANDDSLRCISLIAGVLGRAGQAGLRRREAEVAEWKLEGEQEDEEAMMEEEEQVEDEQMEIKNWEDFENYMKKREALQDEQLKEINKIQEDLPSTPTLW